MLQGQSFELRTQRWRVPAPEGHQKKQMDGWETKEMCKLFLPPPSFYFHHSHLWVYSNVNFIISQSNPHALTLSPHLTSLDPGDLYQPSLELSSTGSPAACWHLSSLSYFSWLIWTSLVLSPIFYSVHPSNTSYLILNFFFFSLNLCGDFARSIQAAKFHFNLLSPFTCSGHRTGGESHEMYQLGLFQTYPSVSSTWPFQWLCCSLFIFPLWLSADIFFTFQGLSLTPVSLTQSRQACLWCSVDRPEDSAELSNSPSQSWYSSHCSKFLFLIKSHLLSEQLISSFQD